jgi:hypothetical protein
MMPAGNSLPESRSKGGQAAGDLLGKARCLYWIAVLTVLGAAAWVLALGAWRWWPSPGMPSRTWHLTNGTAIGALTDYSAAGRAGAEAYFAPQLPHRRPGPEDLLAPAPAPQASNKTQAR